MIPHELHRMLSRSYSSSPMIDRGVKEVLARRFATTLEAVERAQALEDQALAGDSTTNDQLPPHTPASITPTPHTTHVTRPTSPSRRRASKPSATTSKPSKAKRWRDLNRYEKLQGEIETAARHGGLPFSLNLGIGREGALLSSDDPARRLAHYLSRELRTAIGHDLPYTLVLELVRDDNGYDRLHAHGAVIPGSADLAKVKQAFLRAGGAATGSLAGARQLVLKPFKSDPAGWFSYCLKTKRWGKAQPQGRSIYTTRTLSQIAQRDYQQFGLSRPVETVRHRKPRPKRASSKSVTTDITSCFYSSFHHFPTRQPTRRDSYRSGKSTPSQEHHMPAIYVADDRYYPAVAMITRVYDLIAKDRITALRKFIRESGTALDDAFAIVGADVDQRVTVIEAFGELEPDPFTGNIEECQVKIVIGEIGDVWPENIRALEVAEAA